MIAVNLKIVSEAAGEIHESYFIEAGRTIERIEKSATVVFTAFGGAEQSDKLTFILEFDPPLEIHDQPGPNETETGS